MMPRTSWNAALLDELLGVYTPGARPVVKAGASLELILISEHEQGHEDLCNWTTLGRYMIGLGLAIRCALDDDAKSQLTRALSDAVQQCWFVQEGYATFKQLMYCQKNLGDQAVTELELQLPQSYIQAARYLLVKHSVLNWKAKFLMARIRREELTALANEIAAFVVCKAAMCIPLKKLLSECPSLPHYQIVAAIRRNSPDVRLKLLLPKMDDKLTARCLLLTEDIQNDEHRFARLNEKLEILAFDLCQQAEIEFEPSYFLDMQALSKKLPCHGFNIIFDESISPNGFSPDIVGPLAGIPKVQSSIPAIDQVISLMSLLQKEGIDLHFICEVTIPTSEPLLHLFITCSEVRSMVASPDFTYMDPHMAMMMDAMTGNSAYTIISKLNNLPGAAPCCIGSLSVNVNDQAIYTLPAQLKNRNWHWLVAQELASAWDLRHLLRSGSVHLFPRSFSPIAYPIAKTHSIKAAHLSLPALFNSDCMIKGIFPVSSFEVPVDLCMRVYHPLQELPEVELFLLAPVDTTEFTTSLPAASFEQACVAVALLMGTYSDLLATSSGLQRRNLNE